MFKLICRGLLPCCLLIACALAAGSAELPPLPAESSLPGWQKNGPQKQFSPGNLFDYIDGGAEIFNEFGFQQLTVQNYRKNGQEITIELYRMDGSLAALGMFFRQGGQNQGAADDPLHTARSPYQWTLQKGGWFIQLNAPANSTGLENDLAAFAAAITDQIAAEPVRLFSILPADRRIAGSEFLVRGYYGMQPVYTFAEGDILQLNGRHFAIGADYADAQGRRFTRMIIPYPDPAQAAAVFTGLDGRLDSYLKIQRQDKTQIVFLDYRNEYGCIRLDGDRLDIRLHLTALPD